jgi:transposase-like protein
MVRNSTKFVSYKDLKAVCRDLKKVYSASTEKEALLNLEDFGGSWNSKYPMIQKPWETHWEDLVEFFKYSEEIRKIIYTTNPIESLNFSPCKVTKNRAAFPTDESIYKIMYLAINKASKK